MNQFERMKKAHEAIAMFAFKVGLEVVEYSVSLNNITIEFCGGGSTQRFTFYRLEDLQHAVGIK